MAIRDLGYRPYDGERHGADRNTRVLLRHSLTRAWRSVVVKLVLIFCWVPATGFALFARFAGDRVDPETLLIILMQTQWMTFGFVLAFATGAGAIGYDITHGAFSFFFAKPLHPRQYLMGRMGAVSLLIFVVIGVPIGMLWLALVGLAPPEKLAEAALLLFPAMGGALLAALVLGICSVGISALGDSRALTMTAWVMLFLVPWSISLLASVAGWPWLELGSVPSLLTTIVTALFQKTEETSVVRWYHSAVVIAGLVGACIAIAARRVMRVEVIA